MNFGDLEVGLTVACGKMQVTGQYDLFSELREPKSGKLVYVPAADPWYPEIPVGAYLAPAA